MRKVIGIISYLPEDPELRRIRQTKLEMLLVQCNTLFSLPIIIIAQNWDSKVVVPTNATVYQYDKLGITGARKELRKKFLESEYDYLIMLDDDCVIQGSREAALRYLEMIDQHPDMYGTFKVTLFKLFAISKTMFQLVDFPDLEAERGEIFEDIFLVSLLRQKYPDKEFSLSSCGLWEVSDSAWDKNSTWYHYQYVKKDIGDRTRALLKEMQNENFSR